MKCLRKFLFFLLAIAVLCGSPMAYVNAAENQTKSTNALVEQIVGKGDAVVTFQFDYSDGNSAKLVAVWNHNSKNYDMPNRPTSSFSNDKCYASIVLVNKETGAQVTLSAWCDIYGQTDWY